VMDDHRSIAEVARNIDVHEMTLGKWVKKARDAKEAATPPDALLDESERLELVRLRAEIKDAKSVNAQLLMQVDFAKKVATWFQNSRHGEKIHAIATGREHRCSG
ncbi:MAG TPA: transposase, partial [Aeromicrobium sp.]|nr:transposase [Aeromicrobium sp.]